MKQFIIYLLESGICMFGFYIIYKLFFRRDTFFKFIRYYLIAGLLMSVIIPLIDYSYDVVIAPSANSNLANIEIGNNVNVVNDQFNIFNLIILLYLTGFSFFLVKFIAEKVRIIRLIKQGEKENENDYTIINNHSINSPFSFLKMIFINYSILSEKEKELIVKHERIHIEQKHWFDLLICEIIILFQWFNPLAWMFVKRIKENHEYLVDRAILDSGVSIYTYKKVLVNQSLKANIYSFSNSFSYSHSKRLSMMTKKKSSDLKKMFVLTLLPLFSVFIWASATPNYVISDNNMVGHDSIGYDIQQNGKKLLIIDGKEYPTLSINMIDTMYIESISIIEDDAILKKYGEKGKNGIIDVILKKGYDYSALYNNPTTDSQDIIINGKKATKADLDKLDISEIESFEIMKNDNTDTTNKEEKNVIVVKTK